MRSPRTSSSLSHNASVTTTTALSTLLALSLLVVIVLAVALVLRKWRARGYGALGVLLSRDEDVSELLPHEEDRVVWRVKQSRVGQRLRAHFRRQSSSGDAQNDDSYLYDSAEEHALFGSGGDSDMSLPHSNSSPRPYDEHNVSSSALDADLFG